MKKTSVYLTESEVAILRRLAEREGKSQATVLREALAAYDEQHFVAREFLCIGAGEGDGRSVVDIPEEELMRGFGEW
ncbi:MAG: CopG family transcriptional regulator [Anaerolinea sp.]|nr:CopG family transcriptional regulator [Anaerolinea sp.]